MFLQLCVLLRPVVDLDGAEAASNGGEERNTWRTTDVLHLLQLKDIS